jgi:hypothetical protein
MVSRPSSRYRLRLIGCHSALDYCHLLVASVELQEGTSNVLQCGDRRVLLKVC